MLTDSQKAQIRLYLGYPDFFRFKHTRLESVLSRLSPEAEDLIAIALAKLEAVEVAITDKGVDTAGIKRVDEVWFENGWRAATEIRKTGRMYVSRISIITGVRLWRWRLLRRLLLRTWRSALWQRCLL